MKGKNSGSAKKLEDKWDDWVDDKVEGKPKAKAKTEDKPSVSVEASRQQVRVRIGDGSSFARSFKDGANGGKAAVVKWAHKYIEKLW